MGSMMFRPIGLAIAGPLSSLFGITNFIYILAVLSAVAVAAPLFSAEVRNISFDESS
jgi:hypothetical protein